MHESFVYKWTNLENNRYYIGKHKGDENDGYVSSSFPFNASYDLSPNIFAREILFRGTDKECLSYEQNLIREAIRIDGYEKIYNRTGWTLLSEWKRTCLHCGSIVDPRNQEWVEAFNEKHFENCRKNSINELKDISIHALTRKIGRLMKFNTKESGYAFAHEIRKLRKLKAKLIQ